MKRKACAVALLIFFLVPLGAEKKAKVELPEKYKKWLDEEVVYIITGRERDVFQKLTTDKDRDIFIEAFWKQRDPTPGTPRNEFKEEHYRRLQYANEMYGRSTPLAGWRTDRGRIYIILGAPKNIETYDTVMNVYPTEIWFYLGDPASNLPAAFNVIFFKKEGMGDYILYSPVDHGPQALIADYMQDARNVEEAYQTLSKYEPNLARQTLSLLPSERVMPGTISLASNKLISDIYVSPQKKVEDTYADALLKYKDIVEVEYTANYIANDSLVKVIKDDSGFFLVHYSIEPKKLSVDSYEDKYIANFDLNGRVSDAEGKTVFQYEKKIPITLEKAQLQDIKSISFALQDVFPLVPGNYRFDLLLKNTASKEFSSAEEDIAVPQDVSALQMSSLLLGYQVEKSASVKEIIPFKVGGNQILCQPRKTFSQREYLAIFFQLYGLSDELRSSGTIKFSFLRDEKEFNSITKKISEFPEGGNFIQEQPLASFAPGYYRIKVTLLDGEGKELLLKTEDFEITNLASLPRPLIISKVMPVSGFEEYFYTSGIQLLNKGKLEEAKAALEQAYNKNPNQLKYALGYSQALFLKQDYLRVKEILTPFANSQEVNENVLYFLGKSCHSLGQYQEAISYYQNYLSHAGTNIEILNLLGTCYYQLGNKEEALQIWQKSLEISPNQENIKKLVESLKK